MTDVIPLIRCFMLLGRRLTSIATVFNFSIKILMLTFL
ncbi:unnamed protein product [Arabidopsis halleri]